MIIFRFWSGNSSLGLRKLHWYDPHDPGGGVAGPQPLSPRAPGDDRLPPPVRHDQQDLVQNVNNWDAAHAHQRRQKQLRHPCPQPPRQPLGTSLGVALRHLVCGDGQVQLVFVFNRMGTDGDGDVFPEQQQQQLLRQRQTLASSFGQQQGRQQQLHGSRRSSRRR